MKVPEKIYIQLSSDEKLNLSGIILDIKIRAGHRNPYYITTPKTDNEGKSILTKEDLRGQFEDHWVRALMDYNGNLETAKPIVEVSLWDPAWYRENEQYHCSWDLLTYEKKKWKSRKEEFDYMMSSRNDEFVAEPILVNLDETQTIRLKMKKKSS